MDFPLASTIALEISRTDALERPHPIDRTTGLICGQSVILTGFYSHRGFEAPLRRIRFKDPETARTLLFLTNNFVLPALTITELYRMEDTIVQRQHRPLLLLVSQSLDRIQPGCLPRRIYPEEHADHARDGHTERDESERHGGGE
jgi:hypothetical protein